MTGAGSRPPVSPPSGPLGEFGRIERYLRPLAADLHGAFGLTDDAAVLDVPAGRQLVVTTDAMVAGVHFMPTDPPADIAHKLLAVNLSDLAAKGAAPLAYSLVTSLPKDQPEDWLAAFARGLGVAQRRWGIPLLGGDSVSTTGPMNLTVSALGTVPAGRMIRRAGVRPGDILFVSGTVGDAALGLLLALNRLDRSTDSRVDDHLIARLRRPEPRLALAPVLLAHATASLDISDGLVADLGHLADCSGVLLSVEAARVPLSDAAAEKLGLWPGLLADMLTGGDDYEVAFTVPPDRAGQVLADAAVAGVQVTAIGKAEPGQGVWVLDRDGAPLDMGPAGGWRHF